VAEVEAMVAEGIVLEDERLAPIGREEAQSTEASLSRSHGSTPATELLGPLRMC